MKSNQLMNHSLWLEFEHYRNGKLIKKHEEMAHSWTIEAWSTMINFFLFYDLPNQNLAIFNAPAHNLDLGIVVGGSDKPFDFNDIRLDAQHRIEATETTAHTWMLEYNATEVQPIEYDAATKRWTTKIKRGFHVISSHLGGQNVTIKEVGLYGWGNVAWARDVLQAPIVVEPLDTLHVTYKIHTDMSAID